VVQRALAALTDDGAVIIIEPALRDTSRALHAIRDAVIASAAGHVFAPCTRRTAPCPALADPDDWCHEDRPLELSPRTAELARRTGLRDSGMKLAYLVLRKQPLDLVEAGEAAWRVVSAPRPAKGKLEVIGCSAHGRVPLRLLKRNRTSSNRALEHAERGDVVEASGSPDDARLELAAETRVTLRTLRDR
jgi:ribosomal protein RSM22 (predicted rRNA methylase)